MVKIVVILKREKEVTALVGQKNLRFKGPLEQDFRLVFNI